jgi:hypothetical protein
MKSNGRWELVQRYFRGACDDDLFYSGGNQNRSIIKKKGNTEIQNGG